MVRLFLQFIVYPLGLLSLQVVWGKTDRWACGHSIVLEVPEAGLRRILYPKSGSLSFQAFTDHSLVWLSKVNVLCPGIILKTEPL